MKDYYSILNISPASSQKIIRKSYLKLVAKYHPDRNKNNNQIEEKFKTINEAYAILSNKEKRKDYDDQIRNSTKTPDQKTQSQTKSQKFYEPPPPPFKEKTPDSLDIEVAVSMTLEEAHLGAEKMISFQRKNKSKIETLKIQIPRGMKEGVCIRIKDQGNIYRNQRGSIYVKIKFKKHPLFSVQNHHLIMNVPLSINDAVLGTEIKLPVFHEKVKVKIPSQIHYGDMLKLKNLGLYCDQKKRRGDLILKFYIDIPKQITEEEKAWLQKFKLKNKSTPAVVQFQNQIREVFLKQAS